ncbi:hypothetical protein [Luteibacter yeojuensis]|uniref:hypothetical protein n=1 Tax=Luteibacter yeojuensis TaxID=345309 RepID=UPI0006977953|nr:hypothetical protein [Luteibacter yeojuensis]
MKFKTLSLALCLGLATLSPAAVAQHATSTAAFDARADAGLPFDAWVTQGDQAPALVTVLERLETVIDLPDGTTGTVYLAEVDGRGATLVRAGDRIALTMDDTPPAPAAGRGARHRRFADSIPIDWAGLDDLITRPGDGEEEEELFAPGDGSRALHVWLYIHDDAGENDHAKVLSWYAAWWIRDMEKTVRPGVPIRVSLRARVPGVTNLAYHQGSREDRILELAKAARDDVKARGEPVTPLTRYVLLVGKPAASWGAGTFGLAIEQSGAALISNHGHRHVFAHEVGHLLGATHEAAEDRWNCVTNMGPMVLFKVACRVYTKANDQNIRDYIGRRK